MEGKSFPETKCYLNVERTVQLNNQQLSTKIEIMSAGSSHSKQ